MKPDLSLGKEHSEGCYTIATTQMPATSSLHSTKMANKKYIIFGVSVAVVVAIVAAVALGSVWAVKKSHHDMLKEYTILVKNAQNVEVTETVKVNKEEQTTEIDDPQQNIFIYNDFNKGISVVRTTIGSIYGCFLSPLSKDELSPSAVESYMDSHPEKRFSPKESIDNTTVPKLMPASEPLEERKFLSAHVQKECSGLPMYWLVPVPEEKWKETVEPGDRNKRAFGCRLECGLRCGWFWCRVYCSLKCN